jgi:imidazoleglycerol-phosphate dehydratase
MKPRTAIIERETAETKIRVELNIDGGGKSDISTGIGMLDHLLAQLARHGVFDLKVEAEGDLHVDQHHTVEDIAICLGQALRKAVGEGEGITRMGHALVPMDEALAVVAIDISGRGYAVVDAPFKRKKIGNLESDLISHFLETFAREAHLNLHAAIQIPKANDHHKAEALFKALAKALDDATKIDPRIAGDIPSTKKILGIRENPTLEKG